MLGPARHIPPFPGGLNDIRRHWPVSQAKCRCFPRGCTEDLHFRRNGDRCAELDHCHPAGPVAGHYRGQHLGECPYRRPPRYRFFTDKGHSMAGHRVGLLGHCQFLLCLESVPVDCERGAGI